MRHYFSRLLITADLLQLSSAFDPIEESPFLITSKQQGVCDEWPSGYYLGDASAGRNSSYVSLGRCGVGIHHVSPDLASFFDACQPLGGVVQVVPQS